MYSIEIGQMFIEDGVCFLKLWNLKLFKVKNLPANAGDAGLIPGSGRSPGEEMAAYFSILAWRIPWTEEPGRL